jgi:hypothetical protein
MIVLVACLLVYFPDSASAEPNPSPKPVPRVVTQPAQEECSKPTSESVTSFKSSICRGKPGDEFDAKQAVGVTVFEGMRACRALEEGWRTYCVCMKLSLVSKPLENPEDLIFKIINCSKKPNMQVHCGTFSCAAPEATQETAP